MDRIRLLLLLLLVGKVAFAQLSMDTPDRHAAPEASAVRLRGEIQVDGRLEEAAWGQSMPAENFWLTFPTDTLAAEYQTQIYFTYDDRNLYVGAICQSMGKDYVVTSLRRDFRAGGNDNLTFVFDPFQDNTNALVFGMNPYGVNREALISNGGESGGDFREEWDNKWRGESYIGDGYWSCELVIPFSSLRFPAGETTWNFNAYRFDTQTNTRSTWHHIPQNQTIMSLAYLGRLEWEEAPTAQGANVTLIPYLTGGLQRDFDAETPAKGTGNVGGDAKIAVSSGLNLDLTINPDFSQVEVDRQVINLTRFELFFPERRQFFLENADLFSSFGSTRANPFFSRRIGVTRDTSTGEALQNPIYYGARLSGKLDQDWRVGFLNMQAGHNHANGLPSYNYTVAAVQRRVFDRSNIGAILINRQNFGSFSDTSGTNTNVNRVLGLDYNLATKNNDWNGKAYYHRNLSPDAGEAPVSAGAFLEYRRLNYTINNRITYVGENFDARVGFVPRKNYYANTTRIDGRIYPPTERIIQHGPGLRSQLTWTPGLGNTDREIELFYQIQYQNTSRLTVSTNYNYIYLLEDFDPTRSGDATPLPGQRGYDWLEGGISYGSDERGRFNFQVEAGAGQFFNGSQYGTGGSVTYRYQPYGQVTLQANYRYIDLPEPFASTGIFLIGPRVDLTFSRSLFWTTFLQYNDQIDNVNLNTRLQWRFAPVSDFFLVYTDNYDSIDFGVKNRAVVAKLTYWLNT